MADKIVKLKDGNDYLYPQSVLNGIDTSNLIYTNTASATLEYTATQDCYCICSRVDGVTPWNVQYIDIDGVVVYSMETGNQYQYTNPGSVTVVVKKGQKITTKGYATSVTISAYSIKK